MVARDEDSIGPTGRSIITQFSQDVKSVMNSDKSVTQSLTFHPIGSPCAAALRLVTADLLTSRP
jgi:hypothetical protein